MNTYEVWVQWSEWDDPWCRRTVQGETAGKAKYSFWEYLQDGLWEEKFGTVVKKLRCRKIGGFKVSDLFTNPATFREICERRAIDFAYQGMKIEVDGQCGVIVGGMKVTMFERTICIDLNDIIEGQAHSLSSYKKCLDEDTWDRYKVQIEEMELDY
ncbi:hypothetical protein [Paenibacillus sp. FSL R5-0470]|uniref:hypothetical protein n=1 Tax=Paenibacillus sp. FSL R5-0470 TaxID=2921641 RepID=UPI0030D9A136